MEHCAINDIQAIALAEALEKNPTITTLLLLGNRIGDPGVIALAGTRTITTINLSRNRIGDAGVVALSLSTTIEKLSLEGKQNR